MGIENPQGVKHTRLPETITDHPLLWSAVAVAAVGAAGVGALKTYRALKEHRGKLGKDDQLYDELLAAEESATQHEASRLATIKKFARAISQKGGSLVSLHRRNKALAPLTRFAEVVNDPAALQTLTGDIQEAVDDPHLHPDQLQRALRQVDVVHTESRKAFIGEGREGLYKKGLRVVRPDERQWGQIDQLSRDQWQFQTLRTLRHGLKSPDAAIKPNTVMSSEGWLAVRDHEGKIHGFASFLPVNLDPDQTDFNTLTLQEAFENRVASGNLKDATLMLTNISTGGKVDLEAMEALLYGLTDYAQDVGAHRVITSTYSPNIKHRQQWRAEHNLEIGSYEDWWNRTNHKGEPTDPWRRLLRLSAQEQLGFNPQFMQFEVGIREFCDLVAHQKNLDSTDKVQHLMNQDQVFLDAVPVPLQKIAQGTWECTVPASFMLLYDKKTAHREQQGARLYSLVNLP